MYRNNLAIFFVTKTNTQAHMVVKIKQQLEYKKWVRKLKTRPNFKGFKNNLKVDTENVRDQLS